MRCNFTSSSNESSEKYRGRIRLFQRAASGEYRWRVHGDGGTPLAASERRLPGSKAAGYTFASEAGSESSESERFPERHFDFSFIEDANGYNEFGVERPVVLRRLVVPRDWNGEDLLRHLSLQHPRAQAMAERARIEMWMGRYERSREGWEDLHDD